MDQRESNRINIIDLVNSDPELSELKYHFFLSKMHISSQINFSQFTSSIHKSFPRCKLDPNAISFVQIAKKYDNNIYDVVVGFRKDKEAVSVYQKTKIFCMNNQEIPILLTEVFEMMIQAKGWIVLDSKKQKKDQIIESKQSLAQQNNRKESRSRSRQKEVVSQRKENWAGKLWGIFAPLDWSKSSLLVLMTESLRCAKHELQVQEETKEEVRCFVIYLRSQAHIKSLLSGTRATQGSLLLLKDQEVNSEGLLQAIRQRQIRANWASDRPCSNPFTELCKALVGFKQFNLRVVTVVPLEGFFVIIVQNRVPGIIKFLRISGWKFQMVSQCITFPPALANRWHRFLTAQETL